MRGTLAAGAAFALTAALAFGVTVWPTMYERTTLKLGAAEYPVRIHRVTGETQVLTGNGWLRKGAMRPAAAPQPAVAPASEPVPQTATAAPARPHRGYFDDIVVGPPATQPAQQPR
jgi:hypothetical protein